MPQSLEQLESQELTDVEVELLKLLKDKDSYPANLINIVRSILEWGVLQHEMLQGNEQLQRIVVGYATIQFLNKTRKYKEGEIDEFVSEEVVAVIESGDAEKLLREKCMSYIDLNISGGMQDERNYGHAFRHISQGTATEQFIVEDFRRKLNADIKRKRNPPRIHTSFNYDQAVFAFQTLVTNPDFLKKLKRNSDAKWTYLYHLPIATTARYLPINAWQNQRYRDTATADIEAGTVKVVLKKNQGGQIIVETMYPKLSRSEENSLLKAEQVAA